MFIEYKSRKARASSSFLLLATTKSWPTYLHPSSSPPPAVGAAKIFALLPDLCRSTHTLHDTLIRRYVFYLRHALPWAKRTIYCVLLHESGFRVVVQWTPPVCTLDVFPHRILGVVILLQGRYRRLHRLKLHGETVVG